MFRDEANSVIQPIPFLNSPEIFEAMYIYYILYSYLRISKHTISLFKSSKNFGVLVNLRKTMVKNKYLEYLKFYSAICILGRNFSLSIILNMN